MTTIINPVINSPFTEPAKHFRVVDGQVSGEIDTKRRPSQFFVPVAKPKKASAQLTMQFGGGTRQQQNEIVNEIRAAVGRWRLQAYPHTTAVTKDLLAHWRSEDRDRRLFFCQIEAAETAIYLTEAAEKLGDIKALNVIRAENARLNDGIPRLAFKMATGSGKTVVMGADDPYDKLRRALKADISEEAWSTINSTVSRPFPRPQTGKVAVKVINHYGDEVIKVIAPSVTTVNSAGKRGDR